MRFVWSEREYRELLVMSICVAVVGRLLTIMLAKTAITITITAAKADQLPAINRWPNIFRMLPFERVAFFSFLLIRSTSSSPCFVQ